MARLCPTCGKIHGIDTKCPEIEKPDFGKMADEAGKRAEKIIKDIEEAHKKAANSKLFFGAKS